MADASHLDTTIFCPACITKIKVRNSYMPDMKMRCPGCAKLFRLSQSIVEGDTHPFDAPDPVDKTIWGAGGGFAVVSTFVVLSAIAYGWAWQLGRGMDGPTFLFTYAGIAIAMTIAQWILRISWQDKLYISFLAAGCLIAISVGRYQGGMQVGMTRYGFLFILTIIAVVIQFLRENHLEGVAGAGSSCSGGCGGGGGGCGGGCGGCGG